jgi:hypothetical protein
MCDRGNVTKVEPYELITLISKLIKFMALSLIMAILRVGYVKQEVCWLLKMWSNLVI